MILFEGVEEAAPRRFGRLKATMRVAADRELRAPRQPDAWRSARV